MTDAKDFEYRIKGLEEGYWRAINYKETQTIRDAADSLYDTLYDLAQAIDNGTLEE